MQSGLLITMSIISIDLIVFYIRVWVAEINKCINNEHVTGLSRQYFVIRK